MLEYYKIVKHTISLPKVYRFGNVTGKNGYKTIKNANLIDKYSAKSMNS